MLPLFLAMLALPPAAANRAVNLPGWLRWGLRLAVVPLAAASLSPVWTPAVLTAPEFRLQTLLAATAIGLAVIAPLLKGLPLKPLVGLMCLGSVSALIIPARQFGLIQASMGEVYHEPVSLGWGWWLTVGGMVLSVAGGIGAAFLRRRS